ncbi:hypothetical protein A3860_28805 [Niastella vici]|uniref:TonB C-terminal domain-containing protein n=1 Tax=Niastella vici TaxID=1703345 RepID=A0A1V9FVI4_9BACT|nr:carboxypeptidase-like regulatory domain-containing protein [Niastella vici]OQP62362.1 hypothetical protein A3860_28805 [Niastella vici]
MSGHKEHTSHYTAADIQRYVQGKLSAREMHAMEKAALDDPFLADAIEGMQEAFTTHEENLVTGQLQQLQQQIKTRTTGPGKVVAFKPFRYWQAVAAAVIVIITGVWIYTLVNNSPISEQNTIAQTESDKSTVPETETQQPKQQEPTPALADGKKISTDSTVSADAIVTPGRSNATSVSKPVHNEVAHNNANGYYRNRIVQPQASAAPPQVYAYDDRKQQTDSVKQEYNNAFEAAKPAMKDVVAEKKLAAPSAAAAPDMAKARRTDDLFKDKERETEVITIARNDSLYNYKSLYKKTANANKKDNNLSGVIKGQVTDHYNNPIANAYLQIPNTRNNFYTDKTGFFKIPANDSVVDVAVNVSGYGTQNFRLQNNAAMNQLQLLPANIALNEVAITPIKGKKLSEGSNQYPNVMVHDAEPVFGWLAFDQYLEKNKKTPAGAPALNGQVLVSFQVNKKGELSDFKTEQSLSKLYDDEAIRLIKQGPSWKLLKGRKARITVMVRF